MKRKTYYIKKQNSFPNAVIKTSSCYCVMVPRTENNIISKETIVLQIYGNCWLILYNDLTEDCFKCMELIASIA